MMRCAKVYNAYKLQINDDDSAEVNGRWVPARSLGFDGGLIYRLKLAWKVFTGKYDVLQWPGQE